MQGPAANFGPGWGAKKARNPKLRHNSLTGDEAPAIIMKLLHNAPTFTQIVPPAMTRLQFIGVKQAELSNKTRLGKPRSAEERFLTGGIKLNDPQVQTRGLTNPFNS